MDPVQFINDKTSIALEYQFATGFAFPPIIPFKDTVYVKDADQVEGDADLKDRLQSGLAGIAASNYVTPITLKDENTGISLILPVDPLISISGKNIITRRYVSKSNMKGSIKERWSQDDYQINIAGVLIADSADELKSQVQALRTILENGKNGLSITCDLLNNYMDILNIAVEDYEFPHTKGVENQAFTIKAYSDSTYSLLEEITP